MQASKNAAGNVPKPLVQLHFIFFKNQSYVSSFNSNLKGHNLDKIIFPTKL